jgi:very-short-patch-repair endonuclease
MILRKTPTPSENILWQVLRNRKLDGKKFVRQFPIIFEYQGRKRFFVADFYCHEAKLIIELDGKIQEK